MASVNIYDAKTQFSKLVKRVRAGEEIIIADAGKPVAKLVPFEMPMEPRILGVDHGKVQVADDAFAPMTPQELVEWEAGPLVPVASQRRATPRVITKVRHRAKKPKPARAKPK